MKHLFTLFFITISLFSCKETEKDFQATLSESNGKINNVSIIIDDNLWNGEIGDSIRKKFAAPVDGLPQEEPLFTLNQYPTKVFEGFVRKSRNIIVIGKGSKNGFSTKKNSYAKPQHVFFISGSTTEAILNILEKEADGIIKTIKSSEIVENQVRMKKSLVSDAQVQKMFGVSLAIGFGYKYDMVKDKFIWLRKEFTSGYNSILIYEVPIDSIEKDTNTIGNIIAMRDEIGKANIHGTLPNTWMITEAAYAPYLFDVTVAGKKTYLTKGTWELKNDFMAGPFVNYAIKDTKNNRYLIIEGFTYNPSKSKRDLVFELEAIIQSVKFLK
ncbi:DUF4837 domain-containing protein [Flavobacterium cucumis]|jgi:hypothetical protein|uniref:DUF4837 domain-containing protein n=1 Tax=Flavobacterium cucumis TaxID=416016 RepID=A0A1M7ZUC7_9FLAO|nr:DUF4837 family protein [Flavobacterium cucumis]SHO72484.1 protein of unknown function [Flavobacterium cucumis]